MDAMHMIETDPFKVSSKSRLATAEACAKGSKHMSRFAAVEEEDSDETNDRVNSMLAS